MFVSFACFPLKIHCTIQNSQKKIVLGIGLDTAVIVADECNMYEDMTFRHISLIVERYRDGIRERNYENIYIYNR